MITPSGPLYSLTVEIVKPPPSENMNPGLATLAVKSDSEIVTLLGSLVSFVEV